MALTLNVNGVNYSYPETSDKDWGDNATAWAAAITSGTLQKQGGAFTLTADVDFGDNFGLISPYFTSGSSNPASDGVLRLANTDVISWRNAANGADLDLAVGADDWLDFAGQDLVGVSRTQTLTNKTLITPTITGLSFAGDIQIAEAGSPAAGSLQFAHTQGPEWRNLADTAYLRLTLDALGDELLFNGVELADVSSSQSLTNKVLGLGSSISNTTITSDSNTLSGAAGPAIVRVSDSNDKIVGSAPFTLNRQVPQWTTGGEIEPGYVLNSNVYVQPGAPGTPIEGDIWWDSDDDLLKIWDGSGWGELVPGAGATTLVGLTDTNITGVVGSPATPSDNQALTYDLASDKWVNETLTAAHISDFAASVTTQLGSNSIDTLSDVDTSGSPAPANEDLLQFNGSNWVHVLPSAVAGTMDLDDLQNVSTAGKNVNDALSWNGSNWVHVLPSAVAGTMDLDDLQNVSTAGKNVNDALSWNGSNWVPAPTLLDLGDLEDVTYTGSPAPVANDIIQYNGSAWTNIVLNLNTVADVVITTPADNELISYDNSSSNWINKTYSEADVQTVSTLHKELSSSHTDSPAVVLSEDMFLEANNDNILSTLDADIGDSDGTTVMVNNGANLLRSTDGGYTWGTVSKPTGTLRSLRYGNGYFIATTSSGIYSSTDGSSWTQEDSTTTFENAVYDNGAWIASGSAGPTKRATDPTGTWTQVDAAGNDYIAADGSGTWVLGGAGTHLRSTDNGLNFSSITIGSNGKIGWDGSKFVCVASLTHIRSSTDGSDNPWPDTGVDLNANYQNYYDNLSWSANGGVVILVDSKEGNSLAGYAALKTTDGGATWVRQGTAWGDGGPNNNGLFVSNDARGSWWASGEEIILKATATHLHPAYESDVLVTSAFHSHQGDIWNKAALTARLSSYISTRHLSDFEDVEYVPSVSGGEILVYDGGDSRWENRAVSALDHDSLGGVVANEHIDHSSVSINAGTGLSGGGDITTTRTLNLNASVSDLSDVTLTGSPVPVKGDVLVYSGSAWTNLAVGTNGHYLKANSGATNGIEWAAVTATPGGANTQVQFNDSSSLGGDAQFTWNKTTNVLDIDGTLQVDTINEHTAAAGVTIDGLLIKDSGIPEAAVTAHEAALTITESQISDLGSYIENVVEDTTPQLGGDLDANGQRITGLVAGTSASPSIRSTDSNSGIYFVNGGFPEVNIAVDTSPVIQCSVSSVSFIPVARANSGLKVNTINELGAPGGTGVTIDSVLIKDGEVDGKDVSTLIANVVEDTTPQLGGDLDLNQKSIELDPTPTSDVTGNGEIITDTVDVNATGVGALLYVASDGNWEEADASGTGSPITHKLPALGVALESGTGSKKILLRGFIRKDAWAWTVGGIVYASATTGAFTQTAPSAANDGVQAVGIAKSADVIYFNPSMTIVEVASA